MDKKRLTDEEEFLEIGEQKKDIIEEEKKQPTGEDYLKEWWDKIQEKYVDSIKIICKFYRKQK